MRSGTSSPLVFNGGTLQINGTTLTSLNPDRPTTFTSGSTIGFNVNTGTHTFTVGQTLNQGTGGLTKTGDGTLALDAANTYTGVTTVSAGVLRLNNANSLPGGVGATGGTSNLTFAGGAVGVQAEPVQKYESPMTFAPPSKPPKSTRRPRFSSKAMAG